LIWVKARGGKWPQFWPRDNEKGQIMFGYAEAPRAWGFTRGMAQVMGYSLTDAVLDGLLSRKELRNLVQACQSCNQTPDCSKWLARTAQSADGPDFCPNSAGLMALKP
jgi:hypothetical protein